MKLVLLFLVAVASINVTNAISVTDNVSEKEINKSPITKMLSPSSNVTTTRPIISFFPNMPDRKKKFVVNLKPIKTERPTTYLENNRKPLMKKLAIKPVNYDGRARLPVEITTRRSLMKIRKFTVKPHDIYAESVREKHNWNGNRKIKTTNFRKFKNERYTTDKKNKTSNEDKSSEQEFLNFKNVDSSINDNDSEEFGKADKKNSYVAAGSQKIKTILIPKRKKTKYLKVDPEQTPTEVIHENKSVSEHKISSDVVNNTNGNITEDKEKSIITNKVLIKTEPKDTFSDQGKADRNEFMFINRVKQKDICLATVDGDLEISTDSNLDLIVI